MPFLKLLFIASLFLAFSTQALTDNENEEDAIGRFRISAQATSGRNYVTFKSKTTERSGAAEGHGFLGPKGSVEYLVLDFLSFGAYYRALFEMGKGEGNRVFFQDIDAFARFIVPIRSQGGDRSEFLITVPVGFSLMTDSNKIYDTGTGFNLGILLGGNYFFHKHIGITGELGYIFRRVNSELSILNTKEKVSFTAHEISANVGVVFKF